MAHRLSSAGTCLEPRWRGPHRGRGRGDRRPRRSGLALAAPWRGTRRDAPSFLYRHSFSEMPFTHRAARPCEAPCSVFSSPLQGAQSHPSLVLEPVCLPLHRKPRTRQQLALPPRPHLQATTDPPSVPTALPCLDVPRTQPWPACRASFAQRNAFRVCACLGRSGGHCLLLCTTGPVLWVYHSAC